LVVGKTGSGKTTFIDSFCNYLLGIKLYDKFRYRLVDESGKEFHLGDDTKSKTIETIIYHIPSNHIKNDLGSN